MVISSKYKFVFIMVPKTASQSLRYLLINNYNGYMRRKASHDRDIPDSYRDWYTFCCVRNPYSRAISLWFSTVYEGNQDAYGFKKACGSKELLPFLEWLARIKDYKHHNVLCYPQTKFLKSITIDKILRFETLSQEVKTLPFWQGGKIPKRNVRHTRRPYWTTYYKDNPHMIELVQQWADKDFDEYNYNREI